MESLWAFSKAVVFYLVIKFTQLKKNVLLMLLTVKIPDIINKGNHSALNRR